VVELAIVVFVVVVVYILPVVFVVGEDANKDLFEKYSVKYTQ
jgi:hypothetical protein